jgi:hypothetical protein
MQCHGPEGISRIEELRRALTRADASAYLVEGRVIRRVIREQFGFARMSASIPHTESQVVAASDVRQFDASRRTRSDDVFEPSRQMSAHQSAGRR